MHDLFQYKIIQIVEKKQLVIIKVNDRSKCICIYNHPVSNIYTHTSSGWTSAAHATFSQFCCLFILLLRGTCSTYLHTSKIALYFHTSYGGNV